MVLGATNASGSSEFARGCGDLMVSDGGSGPLDHAMIRDIRRLWGDDLVPVPPDVVERPGVTPATAALLREVGLPSSGPVEVEFFHDEQLLSPVVVDGVTYLGLGMETGILLLGLCAGTDDVRAVVPDVAKRPEFINSSLAAFLLFLGLLRARLDDVRSGEDTAAAAVEALQREFVQRDARALNDVDAWWLGVLEQALAGAL